MKKTKIIVFTLTIVALLCVLSIGIVAANTSLKEQFFGLFVAKDSAVQTKIYTTASGEKTNLTYDRSLVVEEDIALDIYIDDAGNEYRYNSSGKLVSISKQDVPLVVEDLELTEEQVIRLALAKGKELYGDEMNGFSPDFYRITATGRHYIRFAIYYGEEDFVLGPTISFNFKKDGTFASTTNKNGEEYGAFDEDVLEGISKKTVEEAISKQVSAQKYKGLRSHTVETIALKWDGAEYYLDVLVQIEQAQEAEGLEDPLIYRTKQVFRYDLEQ